MCRIFLAYSQNAEAVKAVTIAMSKIAYEKGNKDGFFALVGNIGEKGRYIRTLNFDKYLRFLVNNSYTIAFNHLRLASVGKVSKQNVHGFKVRLNDKMFFVAMNGSFDSIEEYAYDYESLDIEELEKYLEQEPYELYKSKTRNYYYYYAKKLEEEKSDTRIFAEILDMEKDVVKAVRKFLEKYYGYGTTFIVSEDFVEMYIWVFDHTCYICEVVLEKPKAKVYVLTSLTDIVHELKDIHKVVVTDSGEEEIVNKIWMFKIRKKIKKAIYSKKIRIKAIKTAQIPENRILYINLQENTMKKLATFP